jgi:glycosyltransferase involved in cell wall biosynthesis
MNSQLPVRRLSAEDVRAMGAVHIPQDAHVIIPTKNKAGNILTTLIYLAGLGFRPDQVHVVINGCTDNSEQVARESGLAMVHKQDTVLRTSGVWQILTASVTMSPSRIRGKGVAMLTGLVTLWDLDLDDDAPIFFLDADISNISDPNVDPITHLLAGWIAWSNDRPDIIKLASQNRRNEGIISLLNATIRFKDIASLEWPLCGQVVLPWGILKQMRLGTGYTVEMTMLIDIMERRGSTQGFAEVAIGAPLVDDVNSDYVHVHMYTPIMRLLLSLLSSCPLHLLEIPELREFNGASRLSVWTPSPEPDTCAPAHQMIQLDALMPPLATLMNMVGTIQIACPPETSTQRV